MAEQHILEEVRHRPWPLPERSWAMHQSWRDLIFMHWPVPYEKLWPLVPHNLVLETFNNTAWLGITPLEMREVHVRGLPGVPGATDFPEINVRTYVRHGEKPGVFFFSLDAGSHLAVTAARALLNLRYHHAKMAIAREGDKILFASRRDEANVAPAELVATYGPAGSAFHPKRDTLEHFLTERYCLYSAAPDGALARIEIQHGPWLLRDAELAVGKNTMADYLGLVQITDLPPLAHYAARQDTLIWTPDSVE
jgi:uncharacterized protein YqjF (DUF2071 family)